MALNSWPACPMCFSLLKYRGMPGLRETHWYCSCGTQWKVEDLLEAYDQEKLREYENQLKGKE